jgi:hypothetical protein
VLNAMRGFAGGLVAWGPVALEVLEAEEVEWFAELMMDGRGFLLS